MHHCKICPLLLSSVNFRFVSALSKSPADAIRFRMMETTGNNWKRSGRGLLQGTVPENHDNLRVDRNSNQVLRNTSQARQHRDNLPGDLVCPALGYVNWVRFCDTTVSRWSIKQGERAILGADHPVARNARPHNLHWFLRHAV